MRRKVTGVGFIVMDGDKILVERRRDELKDDASRMVTIPGGHVEEGESLEDACMRELEEELGLQCDSLTFLWKAPHSTPHEDQMVHYFICNNWRGTPVNYEAEEIFWISLDEKDLLGFDIDREAVRMLIGQLRKSCSQQTHVRLSG